ncbi:MAG: hypothetical protein CMN28_13300 [Salinisphaeraceae bacterium]|nr:hypothetical protein [Salinisphaeraceae bacterium]
MGPVSVATDGRVAFGSVQVDAGDPRRAGHEVYTQIGRVRAQLNMPQLLRAWHFLPRLNAGEGDQERYRLFCSGRREAIDAGVLGDHALPAATVVGADGEQLLAQFLLCQEPLEAIENPRQISAYEYPRRYGPHPPAFARAARVRGSQLLLSGTASIVGHETRHAGDVVAQLDESLANVEALISAADGDGARSLAALLSLRVYLRHADDSDAVQRRLRDWLPDSVPRVFVRADLCREDLLIELEGTVSRA